MAGQANGQPDPSLQDDSQDPGALDTQTPPAAPPADDESGHGDPVQQPSASPSAPPSGQPDDEATRREAGKLRQVQEQLKQYEQDMQRLRNIEKRAMESPDKFKRALVDFSGYDDAQAEQYVEQLKRQGTWGQQQPQGQPNQGYPQVQQQPMVDPYRAAEEIFEAKNQALKIQSAFFEKVPELDPRNVPAEKQIPMMNFAKSIEWEARRRLVEDPKRDIVETLVDVYKDYTGRTDEQLNEVREQARMQGYLEANATKAASGKSSKGYSPRESSFGLSPTELKQAQEEGLTPAEFAKLKDPVSIVG